MISIAAGEFLLRLFVAMVLGLGIGLEREFRSDTPRAAGMRTLALVAMGSALFTLISAYGFVAFTSNLYSHPDPSRIAAQIVSGIGFLGAGAILLHKQIVRGMTTAAAIWATAAIGMAAGLGLYVEAIGSMVLALAVLEALRPIETRLFPRHQQSRIRMRLKPESTGDPLEAIQAAYREIDIVPRKLTVYDNPHGALIVLEFEHHDYDDVLKLVQQLRALPMVRAIRTDVMAPRGTVMLSKRGR